MKKLFLPLLLIICSLNLNAQFLKTPDDVKSPNAASLGKYGDLPVSYAYGTVNVNVPIHSLNSRGIPLDISLSYDTSGIRLNAPAGSVGLNWTLNAPGVITRQIKGLADEVKATNITLHGEPLEQGYFYTHDKLNTQYWGGSYAGELNLFNLALDKGDPREYTDTMPDEFTFNFMGHTGKFFMGQDGHWKVRSDSNLEIIIEESDFAYPANFYSFQNLYGAYTYKTIGEIVIKDENGTIFTFGSSQNSIEYTCGDFYNQSVLNTFPSAWYLDTVENRHGEIVYTFTFERGDPIAFLDSVKGRRGAVAVGNILLTQNIYDTGVHFRGQGNLISPVYLTDISTKNESVELNYSISNTLKYVDEEDLIETFLDGQGASSNPEGRHQWNGKMELLHKNFYFLTGGYQLLPENSNVCLACDWNSLNHILKWKKLDNIIISKNTDTPTREINFDYFEIPTERLFLKKVSFKDRLYNNINSTYNYEFTYNNGWDGDLLFNNTPVLPKYLRKGVDLWGYYNQGSNIANSSDYNELRETSAKLNLKKIGTLRKIKYPTGGTSEFEFESNTYSSFQDFYQNGYIRPNRSVINPLTGGLRIKKIINTPDVDVHKKEIVEYQYTESLNSSLSSGILDYKPILDQPLYQIYTLSGALAYIFESSTAPIIPLSNFSGSNILYSKVFEKKTIENKMFYNEYTFSDHWSYPDIGYVATLHTSHSIADTHISKSHMRGKLVSKKTYDSDNNLIKSVENIYRNDWANLETMKVRGADVVNSQYVSIIPRPSGSPYVDSFNYAYGNTYEIYYGDFDVQKTITKNYFNGNEVVSTTNYFNSDFPYKTNGTPIYTGSRRLNSTSTINSKGETLSNQLTYQFDCPSGQSNCFNNPIGLVKSSKNYKGTTLLSQEDITYRALNSNPNSLVVDAIKGLKNGQADGEKIIFSKYDSKGNVIEYYMENGIYTSYIYDNTGKDLLGKIENARYSDLTSYLPEIMRTYNSNATETQQYNLNPTGYFINRGTQIRSKFTQMRNELPNAMITSYTYDLSHRLYSLVSPDGLVTFFSYDGLDRLTTVTNKDGKILKSYDYNYKQ